MTGYLLNYGCGPHRAPAPWFNVDCVAHGNIRPDFVVSADPDEAVAQLVKERWMQTASKVYLGHVLEHMTVDDAVRLLRLLRERVCTPGGTVLVVGPDMDIIVAGLVTGKHTLPLYHMTAEAERHHQDDDHPDAEAARHHWNCTATRVTHMLEAAGFMNVGPESLDASGWPIVSNVGWQCAVRGTAPA